MTSFTRRELGWQPFFERQLSSSMTDGNLLARVAAHYGGHILFFTEQGELMVPSSIVDGAHLAGVSHVSGADSDAHDAHAMESPAGDMSATDVAVGDWFVLDATDHRAVLRLRRTTLLSRKAAGETVKPQLIAANVDTVFIVSSCNQDFNLSRIERYLALALESGCAFIVVLTKSDLCEDPATLAQQTQKLHRDVIVETLDARDPAQCAVLDAWCGVGQTLAMLGSSGVGKSTLANAMGGHAILTQKIREDDAKGRHTTTARSMHRLQAGGWLIDSPGMRELQLPSCEQGVADLFEDLLAIAEQCQFRNCAHQGDEGCAVEAAVEAGDFERRRLVNYLKLQSEQRRNASSLAERRAKDRSMGKMYKRVIGEKRSRRDGNLL